MFVLYALTVFRFQFLQLETVRNEDGYTSKVDDLKVGKNASLYSLPTLYTITNKRETNNQREQSL
jgi:hypothetical protein